MMVSRVAVQDVELAGCPVHKGDHAIVMIGSANTDEAEFPDADDVRFDREVNRHIAFGGGIHRCLGSHLARLELRVLLDELLGRFSSVRVVKPVEWTRSNRHTGIRHLVVELRA